MPWYDMNKHVNCTHDDMKDFCCWSFGDNKFVEHYYCPDCKAHWFKGKFYTHKQWDEWINDMEIGKMEG